MSTHDPDHTIATLGGETMGTTWCVRLCAARTADLHALHADIQAQLDLVIAQMSTYEADSDISRYNRAAAGQWQVIPAGFTTVLACALEVAQASGGAFDPTIGSLLGLWGFGAEARATARTAAPDPQHIADARRSMGWQRIELDRVNRRVLQSGGLHLDLSAIAKGHAADQVAAALRANGIDSALVEVGGELCGFGRKPDGEAWRVLVEAGPEEDDHSLPPRVIELDGIAIATSGDRWHHYERAGHRYTHTIDPRSGNPLEHELAAVSVIASDAMHADAWATALSVLGPHAGLAFARQHQLAARFLRRDDDGLHEDMTPAFQRHLLQ